MKNIITPFETTIIALAIIVGIVFWYATPASAGQTCYYYNTNSGTHVNCY